jgi:hypothetical protein
MRDATANEQQGIHYPISMAIVLPMTEREAVGQDGVGWGGVMGVMGSVNGQVGSVPLLTRSTAVRGRPEL